MPFYIFTWSSWKFQFLHTLASLRLSVFLNVATRAPVQRFSSEVLDLRCFFSSHICASCFEFHHCATLYSTNTDTLCFQGFFFQVKILILLLISSLTHGLFRSILFSFQILESSPEIFLLLVSNLIELWSENLLCITYIMFIFFHLWTLVLWARIWSLLVNALCALDNNDYSVIIGQSSTNTNQIELVDSVVQVFYVLNDFLSVPSVIDKGVLKFLTIITDLSIFPCNSHFFFMCSRVLSLSMYI